MDISNQFKKYRQRSGLSFRKLSDKTGISEGTLFKIESGKTCPRLDTAYSLAKALNCTVNDFIT